MKIWKSLLVLVAIVLCVWGGYWVFQNFFSSKNINSLELIRTDAVFVFETEQADQTWNELVNQPVWDILSQLPAFAETAGQLVHIDSLSGGNGEISRAVRGKQVTISCHPSGADSFDLLFTVNFGANSPEAFLSGIKSRIPKTIRLQSRRYSDVEILEFLGTETSRKWSATVLGNVLLASSSSFIIEEAIRLHISEDQISMASKLDKQLPANAGLGRLILSAHGISRLLAGISAKRENPMSSELALRDAVVAMDMTLEEGRLVFQGPLILQEEIDFTPSVRANFPEIQKLISNRTQSLAQINLDGIFEAQKLQNRAFTPKSTTSGEIQTRMTDRGFLDNFSGELYFLELENIGNQAQNQVLLLRTLEPAQTFAFLKEFRSGSDSDQSDFYRDSEILFFPEEEFPAHLFGGKFSGFPQTHISLSGEVLILANSAQGMKMVLDDVAIGNTWAKAPESAVEPKSINPASGYSKNFYLKKVWEKWEGNSNPSWSAFLQKYEAVFKAFPYLSLKVNQISGKPIATLTLPYEGGKKATVTDQTGLSLSPSAIVALPERITYGPKTIRNFNDNTDDLVVQDAADQLYLINSAGEVVYSQQLSGPIVSEAFQIDHLKNGKLQLLVATADRVYGIDRLGNPLPGFPVAVKNEKFTHLSLADYDNTRDYRYFLATRSGNLWLLDRDGKELEGWNPLKLGEKSILAPCHIRVPGRGDFMVAQSDKGKVYLFNRRGEKQSGSPLSLGRDFSTPIQITAGAGGNSLKISAISDTGELIQASFGGEITYRNQLVKTDRDTKFQLLADPGGLSQIILSRQYSKTQVMDERERTLFTLPLAGDDLWFGYFDFGSDRQILAVSDPEQGFGYLYDLAGNMLTTTPLESEGSMQISHQPTKNQYLIRTFSGKRVLEYRMPD
ncbi:hypothetical protein J0A68_05485 [Algoriphagus sp. H41]|uniref:Uncharacterized protein n=1 Tax=Algoriphagus oliviformis TaxID=2811231 RepID=A0ABS3C015_9BACT|nr:hypothetical protein [Algoriphagus oliviformis]MBN7810396.1 hypothetical protein [Algoriphagus oliviformis]